MYILTKEEMFSADSYTVNELGVMDEILMENAGLAVAGKVTKIVKRTDRITVICGSGNNGGDGIVVARRLKNLGFRVKLILADGFENFKKAAKYHFEVYKRHGYEFSNLEDVNLDLVLAESDVVVDAIFGIGFSGVMSDSFGDIIGKINRFRAKVIAVDVPSGISADGDGDNDCFVKADFTVTISNVKLSAFSYRCRRAYGRICVVDAGIIFKPKEGMSLKRTWGLLEFKRSFIRRAFSISKSTAGKALIIGGCEKMVGALILCAQACFKSGIGLIKLATTNYVKKLAVNKIVEATYAACREESGFLEDCSLEGNFDVIACGPGLGRENFSKKVVEKVVSADVPIILDADALYFLDSDLLKQISSRKKLTILTPHFGEMARLCGCDPKEVALKRFEIAKQKAMEWNCYLVLKGFNTVVTTPSGNQFVNLSGNEGLASGGTGDVLTGILASFIAGLGENGNVQYAISNAVFLHGKAADLLVKNRFSRRSLVASNLIIELNRIFKRLNH